MINCTAYWLGEIEFRKAWELQNRLARAVFAGTHPPALLLLEHPHVYTIGRSGSRKNLLWDEAQQAEMRVDVIEIDRGGDVTYHGPGQLVGYPILPLVPPNWVSGHIEKNDFVGYIRKLEKCLIAFFQILGVETQRLEGKTGVWITRGGAGIGAWAAGAEDPSYAKIASIGVKVDSKGVTRHGFAANIVTDMQYWRGIVACGIEGVQMANLCEVTRVTPGREELLDAIISAFAATFSCQIPAYGELEQLLERLENVEELPTTS